MTARHYAEISLRHDTIDNPDITLFSETYGVTLWRLNTLPLSQNFEYRVIMYVDMWMELLKCLPLDEKYCHLGIEVS